MKYLLSEWSNVRSRIAEANRVLLMSDFDGTLAPIVARPELSKVSERTRSLLESLAKNPKYFIAIVSGRSVEYLKSQIALEGVTYAGNHGLEIVGPGHEFVNQIAEDYRPVIDRMSRALVEAFHDFDGVVVEHKGLSLSVHYRQVKQSNVGKVRAIFDRALADLSLADEVKITEGKKVFEVRPPVEWGKGQAVSLLLDTFSKLDGGSLVSLFIGDDVTDEDGFIALNRRGGVSIFVGDAGSQSSAQYYLESPKEVQDFLELLTRISD